MFVESVVIAEHGPCVCRVLSLLSVALVFVESVVTAEHGPCVCRVCSHC